MFSDRSNHILVAIWGAWVLFWLLSARGTKRAARRTGLPWRFAVLATILVLALGLGQFPQYFQRPWLPPNAAWVYLGLALTVCGLGFTVWARRVLGTNWSATPSIKEDHELIERGPYRLVRHPIYTGLLLALFGSCLVQGRTWSLAVFGIAVILLIVKLKAEEALLTRQFPDAYPDYRRRVRALIPFLY